MLRLRSSQTGIEHAWKNVFELAQKREKAESVGIDQSEILTLLRILYICPKASDDTDLRALVYVLEAYGLLLIRDDERGRLKGNRGLCNDRLGPTLERRVWLIHCKATDRPPRRPSSGCDEFGPAPLSCPQLALEHTRELENRWYGTRGKVDLPCFV